MSTYPLLKEKGEYEPIKQSIEIEMKGKHL